MKKKQHHMTTNEILQANSTALKMKAVHVSVLAILIGIMVNKHRWKQETIEHFLIDYINSYRHWVCGEWDVNVLIDEIKENYNIDLRWFLTADMTKDTYGVKKNE